MAAATRSTGAGTGLSATRHRLHLLLVAADPERRGQLKAWLDDACEVHAAADAASALALALDVVPGLVVADASAGDVERLIDRMREELAVFDFGVLLLLDADAPAPAGNRHLHLRRPFTRDALLSCIAEAATPQRAPVAMLRTEQQRREEAEALLALALDLTSRHEPQTLLQRATDAAARLTGASRALFVLSEPLQDRHGGNACLCAGHGVDLAAHGDDAALRSLLADTFVEMRAMRSDDVQTLAPAPLPPHFGDAGQNVPIRSYLAVPVACEGTLLGGLFLGHPDPALFSQRSERIALAVAAEAAIALSNARRLDELERAVAAHVGTVPEPHRSG